MMRRFVLLFAVVLASPAAAAPQSFVVGHWFGQGQPNDKSEMWLAHMLPNGDFHVQFRACRKGKAADKFEDGKWSLVGDMETINIVMSGGQYWPRSDVYQILTHDAHRQSYRYLRTGFVYTSNRVDANYPMPACDLVS